MSDVTGEPIEERSADATDPFATLSDETRLEIVRALYEARTADGAGGLSYSRLRERIGMADKGNFNYHLGKLRGEFVEKCEAGYRLTFAGFEIAKVIRIDAWTDHEPRGPVALDERVEGEPLTAAYEDSVVTVRAGEEGRPLFAHAVRPVGAAARETDELLEVASRLWRHTSEQILEGICPYCQTSVDRSTEIAEEGPWTYVYGATCPECGPLGGSHVGAAVADHPAVVSFYWEHGIDVRARRIWELPFVDDEAVVVLEEEPLSLGVDVRYGDDVVRVTVDDAARVVDTERRGP